MVGSLIQRYVLVQILYVSEHQRIHGYGVVAMHVIILICIMIMRLLVVVEVIFLHINVVNQIGFDCGVIMEILVMENVLDDMNGIRMVIVKLLLLQTVVIYHIHVIQYL